MIEYMDKMVGNVVTKLRQTGLLENTLIVVTGYVDYTYTAENACIGMFQDQNIN